MLKEKNAVLHTSLSGWQLQLDILRKEIEALKKEALQKMQTTSR